MGRAGHRYGRSRRASLRVRRRRTVVGAAGLVLIGILVVVLSAHGHPAPAGSPAQGAPPVSSTTPISSVTTSTATSVATSTAAGRVTAVALAAHLPSPLSREATFALGHGNLLLLGGLTSADTSSNGAAVFDTATGTWSAVGTLSAPTHDAGGAISGHRALVFGGGQATSVATVQAFPLVGVGGGTAPSTVAQVVGELPGARSDAVAVASGGSDYIVGGYDGTSGDAAVLETTDGRTFTTVATLPVPVRYPAVAALDGLLYVLGGEAVAGPQAGQPVDDVQVVDPARHTARVAGHLNRTLEGAAAVNLGGRIYVAGGDSGSAPGAASAGAPVTVATVLRFDPRTDTATAVAQLPVAVSYAGVAVSGTTAWLVGGETDGTVRAAVQRLSVTGSP